MSRVHAQPWHYVVIMKMPQHSVDAGRGRQRSYKLPLERQELRYALYALQSRLQYDTNHANSCKAGLLARDCGLSLRAVGALRNRNDTTWQAPCSAHTYMHNVQLSNTQIALICSIVDPKVARHRRRTNNLVLPLPRPLAAPTQLASTPLSYLFSSPPVTCSGPTARAHPVGVLPHTGSATHGGPYTATAPGAVRPTGTVHQYTSSPVAPGPPRYNGVLVCMYNGVLVCLLSPLPCEGLPACVSREVQEGHP